MRRERRLMPLQEFEQALQVPQSEKLQSMVGSHVTLALQMATSRSLPAAGVPHSVAITSTFRVLNEVPPPHVCEHGDQASHSDHLPSMHAAALQGAVAQACTSSRSCTLQALPPSFGATAMCRSRERMPPPQLQLQEPHSDHSPQAQSVTLHCGFSLQGTSSERLAAQPTPPGFLFRITVRSRRFCPAPQEVVQAAQVDQSLSSQSSTLQGMALQPRVAMSSAGHSAPPLAA
mmetsp:Transcript_125524/g.390747  ORF Transcript_125524/g.390747 Transcript_125524/m.390747 type:complete len:232 (+) Transcript_125524:844-1539(+)